MSLIGLCTPILLHVQNIFHDKPIEACWQQMALVIVVIGLTMARYVQSILPVPNIE